MEVVTLLPKREFSCNIYLIKEGKECLVVDPGSDERGLLSSYLEENELKVLGYLLTHGHFDHIGGLMSSLPEAAIYIHEEDKDFLYEPKKNASFLAFRKVVVSKDKEVITFKGGERMNIGPFSFEIIHTPYHTLGSSSFYFPKEKILFSGDALFKGGMGRTDLYGGDETKIPMTFRRFKALPPQTIVYPGHEEITTIGDEEKYNEGFAL